MLALLQAFSRCALAVTVDVGLTESRDSIKVISTQREPKIILFSIARIDMIHRESQTGNCVGKRFAKNKKPNKFNSDFVELYFLRNDA